MRRRAYALQYGVLWSFSRDQFERFLERGAQTDDWNLDDFGKRLRGPCVGGTWPTSRTMSTERRSYTSLPRQCIGETVIRPLDWTQETFAEALKQWREHGMVTL